jgi:hypothetical protein
MDLTTVFANTTRSSLPQTQSVVESDVPYVKSGRLVMKKSASYLKCLENSAQDNYVRSTRRRLACAFYDTNTPLPQGILQTHAGTQPDTGLLYSEQMRRLAWVLTH